MRTVDGDVAVVTGGGGGLGAAVSRRLADDGWSVVVVDIVPEGARAVAESITSVGGRAVVAVADISDPARVDELRDEAAAAFGRPVAALVNLAGAVRNSVLSKLSDADFELVLRTHLFATMHTVRAFGPGMKAAGFGRIVNTSSVAARGVVAGISYSSAKGGIEGLTRSAAVELARHGVTVNCIEPGVIATGMFLGTPAEFQAAQVAQIPVGRAGHPEEIAAAVSFLVSPESAYITGQTLTVCGGLSVGALR
ncbi:MULTISPECIES: SDR family NAD(P)-dependent oxidoreductase [Frankia]|uniref:SDR family NAD(P)-dependent oxidoreductase n=1 Tax=Frankia TaxID=1854 RepID=UPI0018D3A01F|nr:MULTISPECIES: SDR family NAD(P)-dependent oxidoreductase [Frankia]